MIDALPELSDPERREEEIAARDSLAAGYIGVSPFLLSAVPSASAVIAHSCFSQRGRIRWVLSTLPLLGDGLNGGGTVDTLAMPLVRPPYGLAPRGSEEGTS